MKIGILGCAHMHVNSYVPGLKEMEGVDVIGIADVDEAKGKEFAKAHGIRCFRDHRELLSEDADAVLIGSENANHASLAVDSARAKKHVIVEKPIATTVEDAKDMIKACRENGVKLMVCFPVRYAPPIKRMKEIVDSGRMGKILGISATNHGTMPGGWFIEKKLSGGGAVMDHTVHVADIMHWVLRSDVKEVYAKAGTLIHDIPVEDCGLLSMEFENGTYATLDTSWSRPRSYPTWGDVTMDVVGEKGSIRVDAFAQHGSLYADDIGHGRNLDWGNDMDLLMLKDFVRCIREELPSPVTGEDGLFALEIALMAYESVRTKRIIRSR